MPAKLILFPRLPEGPICVRFLTEWDYFGEIKHGKHRKNGGFPVKIYGSPTKHGRKQAKWGIFP